jgi:hypothetical protein
MGHDPTISIFIDFNDATLHMGIQRKDASSFVGIHEHVPNG